jgi:hypothetical protein
VEEEQKQEQEQGEEGEEEGEDLHHQQEGSTAEVTTEP